MAKDPEVALDVVHYDDTSHPNTAEYRKNCDLCSQEDYDDDEYGYQFWPDDDDAQGGLPQK